MKGRSKIIFTKKSKRLLKGIEEDESNSDLVSRANWLRTAAGHHTKLANRLINLARTMKHKKDDDAAENDRQIVNGRTVNAYKELAGKCSRKKTLTSDQKDQIKENWKNVGKETKVQRPPAHMKKMIGAARSKKFNLSERRLKSSLNSSNNATSTTSSTLLR